MPVGHEGKHGKLKVKVVRLISKHWVVFRTGANSVVCSGGSPQRENRSGGRKWPIQEDSSPGPLNSAFHVVCCNIQAFDGIL